MSAELAHQKADKHFCVALHRKVRISYTLLRNIFAAFINRSNSKTGKLMHAHTINYSGWLHSNEYRQNALGDNVSAQVIMDKKRNLFLQIN